MPHRFRYDSLTLDRLTQSDHDLLGWLNARGTEHGLSSERQAQVEHCVSELLGKIAPPDPTGSSGHLFVGLLLDLDTATLVIEDAGPVWRDGVCGEQSPVLAHADQSHYAREGDRNRLTLRFGCRSLPQRGDDRRHGKPTAFPLQRGDATVVEIDERSGVDRRATGFVAHARLFRDVPYEALVPILARCEVRDVEAEEVLFRAGEYHHCVLVVMDGRLEVRLDGARSNFCVELSAGECVGELSVADGKPVSAWIVAAAPSRLLIVPASVFLGPMLGVPAIARNLIVLLAERMRRSNDQIMARMRATLELEALRRELDVARQIQSGMLPPAPLFGNDARIEGHGFMRAARQVGGDFYDAFPLSDGRFFVAIGDVCNKGAPAALYMMRTVTVLRSEAIRPIIDIDQHLTQLAARTNNLLNEANDAQQFVTLFFAIIDQPARRLHFINAGHNLPILCLPGQPPAFIQGVRNPLAGVFPDLDYQASQCDFPAGSLLLLYTDGVTEAEAGEDVLFGDDALLALMTENTAQTPEDCIERIVSAVDAFADGHPQSDDITLLAVSLPG